MNIIQNLWKYQYWCNT